MARKAKSGDSITKISSKQLVCSQLRLKINTKRKKMLQNEKKLRTIFEAPSYLEVSESIE